MQDVVQWYRDTILPSPRERDMPMLIRYTHTVVGDTPRVQIGSPFEAKDAIKVAMVARWEEKRKAWTIPFTRRAVRRMHEVISRRHPNARQEFAPEVLSIFDGPISISDVAVSRSPVAALPQWDHQMQGTSMIGQLEGCMLAWDMGAGKTKAVFDAILQFNLRFTIVCCPTSVVSVWKRQFNVHIPEASRGDFIVLALDGSSTVERRATAIRDAYERIKNDPTRRLFVAINFEAAWREAIAKVVRTIPWDLAVADECHRIANHTTRICKFMSQVLAPVSKRRVGLSGTPMGNGPIDAFGQFQFIEPALFGQSLTRFRAEYCNTGEAPIWMGDLSFKMLRDVRPGDEVMGWVRDDRSSKRRRLVKTKVVAIGSRRAQVVRVLMESGRVIRCTPDHKWLSAHHQKGQHDSWCTVTPRFSDRQSTLSFVVDPVSRDDLDETQRRAADWLAGIYDGEGHRMQIAQCPEHNPKVRLAILDALTTLGVPFSEQAMTITMLGGRQTAVNLLNWTRGTLIRDRFFREAVFGGDYRPSDRGKGGGSAERYGGLNRKPDRVSGVYPAGEDEVFSMQTETGNYVAWGYASKNCIMGGFEGRQVIDYRNLDDFKAIMGTITSRVRLQDVVQLPEYTDEEISVELGPEARRMYAELRENFISMHDEGVITAANAISKLLRLQQMTSGYAMLTDEDEEVHCQEIDRGKSDALNDIIDAAPKDEPIVVFCRFVRDIREVHRVAAERGRPSFEISGAGNQQAMWEADCDLGRGPVIAVQIQAGGVGIDLTKARYCVYYSLGFSLTDYQQSRARVHRPGQKRSVIYYHLIVPGTVDRVVYTALRDKRKVVDAVIEDLTSAGAAS